MQDRRVSFVELLAFYENHLVNEVMPFWLDHCIDWEHGGINNCVNDDGTVETTDKYLWSQGQVSWRLRWTRWLLSRARSEDRPSVWAAKKQLT